jgi:hypothetical protein
VILCKAQDLLKLKFIGVPKIDQFQQEFLDYYCNHHNIRPHLIREGTWTTESIQMDLLINPTFADEADIEFINPMAEYFPSPPPSSSSSSSSRAYSAPTLWF